MGIGKTLSDILIEKRSNPNELAERIGVAPSTIYSIIKRDNMKVDITVLARICEALNVKMERFYNDYIEESKNNAYDIIKQQLINNYDLLNNKGKEKLFEYSKDLVDTGNYIDELILSVVAARSEDNVPVTQEHIKDLSKIDPDDSGL